MAIAFIAVKALHENLKTNREASENLLESVLEMLVLTETTLNRIHLFKVNNRNTRTMYESSYTVPLIYLLIKVDSGCYVQTFTVD